MRQHLLIQILKRHMRGEVQQNVHTQIPLPTPKVEGAVEEGGGEGGEEGEKVEGALP